MEERSDGKEEESEEGEFRKEKGENVSTTN